MLKPMRRSVILYATVIAAISLFTGACASTGRAAQLAVLTFGYIPSGRKSPKRVEPTGLSGREAVDLIYGNLEKMELAFTECERRFGERVKIADHPALGPIRLSGWRKFHLLHTRHHMRQIDALTATYASFGRDIAAAS